MYFHKRIYDIHSVFDSFQFQESFFNNDILQTLNLTVNITHIHKYVS